MSRSRRKRKGQQFTEQYFLIFTVIAVGIVVYFFGSTVFSAFGLEKTSCKAIVTPPPQLSANGRYWPVDSLPPRVASCFGKRDCSRQNEVCIATLDNSRGINIPAEENTPVFTITTGEVINYSMAQGYVLVDHYQFKAKYVGLKSLCGFKKSKSDKEGFEDELKDKKAGDYLGNASGPYFHLELFEVDEKNGDKTRNYLDPLGWYGPETIKKFAVNFSQASACVYWSDKDSYKGRSYIDYARKKSNQYHPLELVKTRD